MPIGSICICRRVTRKPVDKVCVMKTPGIAIALLFSAHLRKQFQREVFRFVSHSAIMPFPARHRFCAEKMLRHINAVALDLIMHHMGRKIDLAWPNKRAVLNVHLFEHARITQAFKNAGVFRINQSAHMNLAPQAIGERDCDQVLVDDLHLYNIPRDHDSSLFAMRSGCRSPSRLGAAL